MEANTDLVVFNFAGTSTKHSEPSESKTPRYAWWVSCLPFCDVSLCIVVSANFSERERNLCSKFQV